LVAQDDHARCYHGSFLRERWELRVTRRCLSEDLGCAPDIPFSDVLGREIIKAFVKDREAQPYGTRQVAPLTCNKEVWRLGYGNDHRGATWHDAEHRVIWLLAYHGQHRSGDADDAFPYFKALDGEGRLFPEASDYEALRKDRDRRFVETVVRTIPPLLDAARSSQTRNRQRRSAATLTSASPLKWSKRWRSSTFV